MTLDGAPVNVGTVPEYTALYARFAGLLAARRSDADFTPFALVADAFMRGRRKEIGAFA
jgi:D-galactose 1-dehydrogenase